MSQDRRHLAKKRPPEPGSIEERELLKQQLDESRGKVVALMFELEDLRAVHQKTVEQGRLLLQHLRELELTTLSTRINLRVTENL